LRRARSITLSPRTSVAEAASMATMVQGPATGPCLERPDWGIGRCGERLRLPIDGRAASPGRLRDATPGTADHRNPSRPRWHHPRSAFARAGASPDRSPDSRPAPTPNL
jgi:hypothetical protein